MSVRASYSINLLMAIVLLFATVHAWAADEDTAVTAGYVELDPAFTLNYGDMRRTRYIQTTMTLRLSDSQTETEVKAHSDAIRHTIIMMFSEQTTETLKSTEGRDELLKQLTTELQNLMKRETGRPLIERVLFTTFILQP